MRILAIASAVALASCSGTPDETGADLGALFERLLREHNVPGGVLAVRRSDGAIQVHAAGVTSLEDGRPVTPDDCFYIGSITKLFTATAALQLVDDRRLSLDDTLATYLPDVPRANRITIRQLLNHTSGMGDAYLHVYYLPLDEMLEQLERAWTPEELVRLGTGLPASFEPGAGWEYCGTGYDVVGRIIEVTAGKPLHDVFRERIEAPLGLESTWLAGREPPRNDRLVTGHLAPTDFWPHSRVLFPTLAPSTSIDEPVFAWASGALVSTAREMIAFMDAVLTGPLISAGARREMLTFVDNDDGTPLDDPAKTGYGFGIMTRQRGGHHRLGHGGMYSGFTAALWHLPDADVTVAFTLNRGLYFNESEILDAVIDAVLAERPQ